MQRCDQIHVSHCLSIMQVEQSDHYSFLFSLQTGCKGMSCQDEKENSSNSKQRIWKPICKFTFNHLIAL